MKTKSKFEFKDTRTFSEKAKEFATMLLYCVIFWKGRKKGMIGTMNISLKDIRAVFFPKGFREKYLYLGSIPWREEGDLFKSILPIVLTMDYEAKPKWCPRWFLRFLHLFGSDNSIVRVRNRRLHNLQNRLTGGIMLVDWKTKWSDYDLRISVNAPGHINELTRAIEQRFYSQGRQTELRNQIISLEPNANPIWGSISRLEKQLEELENERNN